MRKFDKKRRRKDVVDDGIEERIIFINRVAKVVKGGRRFNFSTMMVAGDKKGNVGLGLGKGNDVALSIRKAATQARKNMVKIPRISTTIPHDIIGQYSSSHVVLKPAAPGTGIIAGTPVRNVLELAGIQDILTKCLGSRNSMNVVKAVMNGLTNLRDPQAVAAARNIPVKDLMGFEPVAPPDEVAAKAAAEALAAKEEQS